MSGSEQDGYVQNRARTAELEKRVERIRELNDQFRLDQRGGFVTITEGVRALGVAACAVILNAVTNDSEFSPDNDPYGEHDFGALNIHGHKIFWKIDYYDKDLEFGSPDPADPQVTSRVLTVMLASEY